MKAAFQICDLHLVDSFKLEQNYTDDTIFNIIEDIALPLNSTISTCKWRNQKYNCAELYRPVMTEEGLCYTFNALNSKDIYTKKYITILYLDCIFLFINNTHLSLFHHQNDTKIYDC